MPVLKFRQNPEIEHKHLNNEEGLCYILTGLRQNFTSKEQRNALQFFFGLVVCEGQRRWR